MKEGKKGKEPRKKQGSKQARKEGSDGKRDEIEVKSAFESLILELSVLAWEEKRKEGFKKE